MLFLRVLCVNSLSSPDPRHNFPHIHVLMHGVRITRRRVTIIGSLHRRPRHGHGPPSHRRRNRRRPRLPHHLRRQRLQRAPSPPPASAPETFFLGKVGRDSFAADFITMLDREGVHSLKKFSTPRISPPARRRHPLQLHRHKPDLAIDPGANTQLSPADLEERSETIRRILRNRLPAGNSFAARPRRRAPSQRTRRKSPSSDPEPACDLRNTDPLLRLRPHSQRNRSPHLSRPPAGRAPSPTKN